MPVIRGLNHFLTMAEVAEVEGGEVIIDTVAIFYEEGKGANIIARKISLDAGSKEKRLVKSKERIW